MRSIHAMGRYLALKKKEPLSPTTAWGDPETCKVEPARHRRASTVRFHFARERIEFSRGLAEGWGMANGKFSFSGTVFVWEEKKVLEMGSGDGASLHECT